MRRIAVFCASNAGDVAELASASRALVDAIAARGFGIVYGGASVGLMGVVAAQALTRGVDVIGVLPKRLLGRELLMPDLTRTFLVDTMAERKERMAKEADAFIALPGSIGTLEEILEQWTAHYLGYHDKPIGFLDVDGYWQPLFSALASMHARGVVRSEHLRIPVLGTDPVALLDQLLPP